MFKALQTVTRLLAAAAVSLFTLGLMAAVILNDGQRLSVTELLNALRRVPRGAIWAYAVLQLLQGGLRAMRYGLLIRAGGSERRPSPLALGCATFTRNMLVDLLPARAGELSYAAMINRGGDIRGEHALSSMGLSVYFDVLALLLVLVVALAGSASRAALVHAAVALAVVIIAGWLVLFHGAGFVLRRLGGLVSRRRLPRPFHRLFRFADRLIAAIERVRESHALGRVVLLSAAIRVVKYLALYILFMGVTLPSWPALAAAPIQAVLIALIAAEAAASLPIPAFMSFGSYEAGGLLALTALGFSRVDSMLAMLTMHVWSQIVDYSWGGLALLVFIFSSERRSGTAPAAVPDRAANLRWVAAVAVAGCAFVAGGLWVARQWTRLQRIHPGLAPLESAREVQPNPEEARRRSDLIASLNGFVVWSSNRAGNHDLWMLKFPEGKERRLTVHPHADTHPRISPDGRRVVFCRSRLPQVSQRDPVPWEVWMLDLETGRERRLAEEGFTPMWTEDGDRVIFDRGGRQVVELDLHSGEARILYESGQAPVPEGVILQTPDWRRAEARLAVTFRGRLRDTRVLGPGDRSVRIGSGRGCQLNWAPDGSFLYYVDHGGRGGNTIFRAPSDGSAAHPWLDLPEPWSHEYFPRLSRNGGWLILGASAEGHEHDRADYELFLWPVGEPPESAVRLTFHTGNDCWPDIWIESEFTKATAQSLSRSR